jgi:transcriptional regulator with XRE-family HTH domain
MGFPENLRRLRTRAGLTQAQVADKINVPYRTYQNWELGSREPAIAALKTIAKALGVSFDELLENGPATPPAKAAPAAKKARRKK